MTMLPFVNVGVLLMEGKENRKTAKKKKKSRYIYFSGDQTLVSAILVLASRSSLERELQELWGGRHFKSLSKVLWEPVSVGS